MPPKRRGLAFLAQCRQASGGLSASVALCSSLVGMTCTFCLQALLPEALVPLTLMRHAPGCRVLLCGDPKCASTVTPALLYHLCCTAASHMRTYCDPKPFMLNACPCVCNTHQSQMR